MMFGTGKSYRYGFCAECISLHLLDIPQNPEESYSGGYYVHGSDSFSPGSPVRDWLHMKRMHGVTRNNDLIGRVISWCIPDPFVSSLRKLNLKSTERILDVGCGNGKLVRALAHAGFSSVSGIDPFLPSHMQQSNGSTFRKTLLRDVEGQYDVVMFHHSFEHVADLHGEIAHASRVLGRNGRCIINMPNLDSYAWYTYGTSWVQIDAPRHIHVLSKRSVEQLVEQTDLRITGIEYNSTAFQFWASEQYDRGIPLLSSASRLSGKMPVAFQPGIRHLERKAKKLNAENKGDQFAVYLEKK